MLPLYSGSFLFIDRPEDRDSEHVRNISNQQDVASRNTDLHQQRRENHKSHI